MIRSELGDEDGVGDATLDVLVGSEGEGGHESGLSEEDEVVILGEVLEEEA